MVRQSVCDQNGDATLLISVAQQLKQPLTILRRYAELAQIDASALTPELVGAQSKAALTLLDNYMFGLTLLAQQQELPLEPVSVASSLVDTAHAVRDFARHYGVSVDIAVDGRYEPVMAHRQALSAALSSLGLALVEGIAAQQKRRQMTLSVHKNARGIVAGLYGLSDLTAAEWRQALALRGRATQPIQTMAGSGAGVFVAAALAQAMDAQVRVSKHKKEMGLAITLQPSQQLQLV